MPIDFVEHSGGKLLAWASALALLVGLLVATSESLHRQEGTFPFMQAVEADLPVASIDPPSTYHDPGVGAWPQP